MIGNLAFFLLLLPVILAGRKDHHHHADDVAEVPIYIYSKAASMCLTVAKQDRNKKTNFKLEACIEGSRQQIFKSTTSNYEFKADKNEEYVTGFGDSTLLLRDSSVILDFSGSANEYTCLDPQNGKPRKCKSLRHEDSNDWVFLAITDPAIENTGLLDVKEKFLIFRDRQGPSLVYFGVNNGNLIGADAIANVTFSYSTDDKLIKIGNGENCLDVDPAWLVSRSPNFRGYHYDKDIPLDTEFFNPKVPNNFQNFHYQDGAPHFLNPCNVKRLGQKWDITKNEKAKIQIKSVKLPGYCLDIRENGNNAVIIEKCDASSQRKFFNYTTEIIESHKGEQLAPEIIAIICVAGTLVLVLGYLVYSHFADRKRDEKYLETFETKYSSNARSYGQNSHYNERPKAPSYSVDRDRYDDDDDYYQDDYYDYYYDDERR